jgi:nucleotide-binding universal stress UspA family protein
MSGTREKGAPESTVLPTFARILLVTDFSDCSSAAVPFASLLAEYYGASIVVCHVVSTPSQAGGGAQTEAAKAREVAEARLREFVAKNPLGESNYEAVIGQGQTWDVLASLVEEKRIDLVVLGTHGRSGVGKLLLGSVAQRIFSLAPCPVLSVSPRARKSWGSDRRLARILYATDFLPGSLKALPYALSLAEVGHAELLLLHVPEASAAGSSEFLQGDHQHLSALIPAKHRAWCKSDTLVTPGDPAQVILDAATRNSVDFIVIGAHGFEGSLASFQVPLSTAYRVVAHAPCPVLRVRS